MPTNDFASYAKPLLDKLDDDPSKELEAAAPFASTTFPGGATDVEGEATPLTGNEPTDLDPNGNGESNEDIDAGRRAYPMVGPDVWAFYKSFRFVDLPPFSGQWGIFLLDAGIASLSAELQDQAPGLPWDELERLAKETLLAHERYHFWIDAWALGQEITPIEMACKRYVYYLAGKRQAELTPEDYEESLANHYTFQRLRRLRFSDGTTASRILRTVLSLAPQPYSDFSLLPTDRTAREADLAHAVANGLPPGTAACRSRIQFGIDGNGRSNATILGASIQPADRWHPIVGWSRCPTHRVRTHNYARLVQPFQGPKLPEFREFVTNYLDGKPAEHTDHDYYKIDNGEKVKFPNPHDKEVRGYELRGTLRQAGMTQKEFNAERDRTRSWSKHCPRNPPKPPL